MVNVTAQALKCSQTDYRHASKNPGNSSFQWLFLCWYTKRGEKYDTCIINKIRIWVDVLGRETERERGEMEINDHFYSTAHSLPKQLKNSCKSRSGELINSSGKLFWGRIFQSGSKTRLWLHVPSRPHQLNSSESTTRYSSFPLRWNSPLV